MADEFDFSELRNYLSGQIDLGEAELFRALLHWVMFRQLQPQPQQPARCRATCHHNFQTARHPAPPTHPPIFRKLRFRIPPDSRRPFSAPSTPRQPRFPPPTCRLHAPSSAAPTPLNPPRPLTPSTTPSRARLCTPRKLRSPATWAPPSRNCSSCSPPLKWPKQQTSRRQTPTHSSEQLSGRCFRACSQA